MIDPLNLVPGISASRGLRDPFLLMPCAKPWRTSENFLDQNFLILMLYQYCILSFSIKPVYSARYPPSEIANQAPSTHKSKSKRGDSFADFDSSTSDVWEINDDELLAMSSQQKLSLERRSSDSSGEGRGGGGVGGMAYQEKSVPYSEQG